MKMKLEDIEDFIYDLDMTANNLICSFSKKASSKVSKFITARVSIEVFGKVTEETQEIRGKIVEAIQKNYDNKTRQYRRKT